MTIFVKVFQRNSGATTTICKLFENDPNPNKFLTTPFEHSHLRNTLFSNASSKVNFSDGNIRSHLKLNFRGKRNCHVYIDNFNSITKEQSIKLCENLPAISKIVAYHTIDFIVNPRYISLNSSYFKISLIYKVVEKYLLRFNIEHIYPRYRDEKIIL